jgi:hypothetical protein
MAAAAATRGGDARRAVIERGSVEAEGSMCTRMLPADEYSMREE